MSPADCNQLSQHTVGDSEIDTTISIHDSKRWDFGMGTNIRSHNTADDVGMVL